MASHDRMLTACLWLCIVMVVLGGVANVQLLRIESGIDALIAQGKPMSTTYTDTNGMDHTVNTPYEGETTAVAHKRDLGRAFCEFPPVNPPAWWNPADCP